MSILFDQQQLILLAVTVLLFIILITGTEASGTNNTATNPIITRQ